MLAFVDPLHVAYYFAFDIGLFLLIKIVRGDFLYWVPFDKYSKYPASFVIRVAVKVVVDFTSVIQVRGRICGISTPLPFLTSIDTFSSQLRHPNEVGGLYWTFCSMLTASTLFVALHLAEESGTFEAAILERLYNVSCILMLGAASTFTVFFLHINPGYGNTFFSVTTGGQNVIRLFHSHTDDGLKAKSVFGNSRAQWASIEAEVKHWVYRSWDKWVEENPAWFTECHKKIPEEFIPSLEEVRKTRGRVRGA